MPIEKVTSPGVCLNSASKTFNKNRKSFMVNETEKSKNETLESSLKSSGQNSTTKNESVSYMI